jgi:hypothetical protein
VHEAEDQQDPTDLGAEDLQGALRVFRCAAVLQGQCDTADIYQVKTNHEKMVYGICQPLVAVEAIHQENAPILVQGARDPNRESDADGQICEVSPNRGVHIFISLSITVISVVTEILDNPGLTVNAFLRIGADLQPILDFISANHAPKCVSSRYFSLQLH